MAICEVSLNTVDCHGDLPIRTKCFACGQPACRGCSEIVPEYGRWRRVRLCNDCLEDLRKCRD